MTRWLSLEGSAEITDLMPHPDVAGSVHHCLIRRVRATHGTVGFRLRCRPRFDYGRLVPAAAAEGDAVVFSGGDFLPLRLSGCVSVKVGEGEARAEFELKAGEEVFFVLQDADQEKPAREWIQQSLELTIAAWREWSKRSTYTGRWREEVARSALALKLLTSHEHGSIAASVTFGLPEATGAGRNWDYRASWIRIHPLQSTLLCGWAISRKRSGFEPGSAPGFGQRTTKTIHFGSCTRLTGLKRRRSRT